VSEAFRHLRACYPRRRLFVIMDNLHNVHDHPRFLALLRRLHIHPVWTPTEASWLNAIEAHFGVTKRATLTGSDDREHVPRRRRIYLSRVPQLSRRPGGSSLDSYPFHSAHQVGTSLDAIGTVLDDGGR
jgi:hypothetical protein